MNEKAARDCAIAALTDRFFRTIEIERVHNDGRRYYGIPEDWAVFVVRRKNELRVGGDECIAVSPNGEVRMLGIVGE